MPSFKTLYHRLVPASIRFPMGRLRRTLIDQSLRLTGRHGLLPPRRVLKKVQMTPWAMEYLEVGARGADTIRQVLRQTGISSGRHQKVLDFGCGLARTMRHLREEGWELMGSDVDAESIAWSRLALPEMRLEVNGHHPPLPFASASFDAVYAISVFSHFSAEGQGLWAEELARVLKPGGVAVVTTMGPWAFNPLPAEAVSPLPGFWFCPAGRAFNDSAAIHTEEGLKNFFKPWFDCGPWTRGGLDGFQDLAVFFRRDLTSTAKSPPVG
jgi:SAM-dependent methyltransferase